MYISYMYTQIYPGLISFCFVLGRPLQPPPDLPIAAPLKMRPWPAPRRTAGARETWQPRHIDIYIWIYYIWIYIYIYIYIYMYIYIWIIMYIYIIIWRYTYIYIHIYIWIYRWMYIYNHIYVYIECP